MKKSDIRAFLRGIFERPKNKWEAQDRLWNKGLTLVCSVMISWGAFANNNGPTLLVLVGLGLFAFWFMYEFIAKGK